MEGLIPMVYKRVKKSLSVKGHYQQHYNIADFYPEGYSYKYPQQECKDIALVSTKRSKSSKDAVNKQKQLVRFRSQKLFSCVTGGV